MDIDTRLAGHFEEHWADSEGRQMRTFGHVVDVIPGRLLRLSWTDEDWPEPTTVEIRLHDAAGGTAVVVHHSGWERLPDGEQLAARHLEGWQMHLDNLRAFLEQ